MSAARRLLHACAALGLLLPTTGAAQDQSPATPPGGEAEAAAPKPRKPKEAPPPLALALDLAFGATLWTEVKVSTHGPVADMTKLIKEGYYKLEIIELVLMSSQGRRPLKETLKKRKEGARLSEIAVQYRLDYDKVYESALAVQEIVDREYLPRFPERRLSPEREDR